MPTLECVSNMNTKDAFCYQRVGTKAKRGFRNIDVDRAKEISGVLRNAQQPQCQFHQSGLTLLEIMITVVILSLGLLGLAGLQMTGLKNNRNAYYNTVAAQVVLDMAERIKADQAGAAGSGYNALSINADQSKCAVATPSFSDRGACLAAALPGGQARVTVRAGSPKTFFVALRWTDIQLNGTNGWAGADTDPVILACGSAAADTSCYFNVVMP